MDITRKTESLGQAVAQNLIPRDAAIQELVEFSDGGITRVGATTMIDGWTEVRAKYEQAFKVADDGLRKS